MLTKNEQILILLIFLIFIYITWKINNLYKKNIEKFTLTDAETQEAIKVAVKKIYLTDVEAIRLLSNFAIQLNQNGITIPGNVKFLGTVTTNNINSTNNVIASGNITASGNINTNTVNATNIDISGSIISTNNITASNITASGNINVINDISLTSNWLKLNNKTDSINKYAINVPNDTNNIMQIGRLNNASNENYDFTNGFKFNGSTGTFECKEIICNKISGPSALGGWIIIGPVRYIPVFFSINSYSEYLINDEDKNYLVMPRYKIIRWSHSNNDGTNVEMNNWDGIKPKIFNVQDDYGSSCNLYYWIGPGVNDFIEIIKT